MHESQPTSCLRPEFTQNLAERLVAGAGLNLIGPHGQGRRRTLQDLRHCLPASLRVLQANLNHHSQSLTTLLDELRPQVGCDIAGSLDAILDALNHRGERPLLILHNFDELHPGTESGYDDRFFGFLNRLRDRPGHSLLCISEKRRHDLPLEAEDVHLPPLTEEQIVAELQRRGMDKPELEEIIVDQILQQQAPYTVLDALIDPNHPDSRSQAKP